MSYTLTLGCGCLVYVAAHPRTMIVHTRIIERRGGDCRVRAHDIGTRLKLWEMLPEPEPAQIASARTPIAIPVLARKKAS
jgi:hypothetical protein